MTALGRTILVVRIISLFVCGGGDFLIGYTVEAFYIPDRDEMLIMVFNDSSVSLQPGRVNTRQLILDLSYED